MKSADEVFTELKTFGPYEVRVNATCKVPIIIYAGPINLLSNIDIIISSENIYFEMAKPYKPSTSGRLRNAAARKGPAGEIYDDIMFAELNEWMRINGRHGLAVPPATIAATSSGELVKQDIRRIYHAAVVTPRIGTNEYDVEPQVLSLAVHNVFRQANRERSELGFGFQSICFPLLGAGRGGLEPLVSFVWMWKAISCELLKDSSWKICFSTWTRRETSDLISTLKEMANAGQTETTSEA